MKIVDEPRGDEMEVEYRAVPNWPAYRVGDDGSIWSMFVRRKRVQGEARNHPWVLDDDYHLLNPKPGKRLGYKVVTLNNGTKKQVLLVHRLVLEAFGGPPPPGKTFACHINGERSDNRPCNLYWGDAQDNANDSKRHGTVACGELAGPAKLSESDVLRIRELIVGGVARRDIAAEFGVTAGAISKICAGNNWKHLSGWDAERFSRKRPPKILTFNGRSQRLADWGRETGIDARTILNRLRSGWTVERALTTPIDVSKRNNSSRAKQCAS